jgi:uncharacterized membrane protein HdeD (DUF308 family)
MNGGRARWYTKQWFSWLLMALGVLEVAAGAIILLQRHQYVQGYGFLVVGALTFLLGPWLASKRPKFNF